MITCILLAAGLSERFGSPKALAKINGSTVIEHLQNQLISSKVSEIIVVLGAHFENIKPYILKHNKVKFVYNKDYNFGQTSSFQCALRQLSEKTKGVMLLPVDYPFITIKLIDSLIDCFCEGKESLVVIPIKGQRKGHPPIFNIKLKNDFLVLDHSVGINVVAKKYKDETLFVPVDDESIFSTFNTKEELEDLKS